MAYSKRRNYKRRNSKYGSRRYSKRAPSNKSLDRKIKKIQRDTELKFLDTYFAADISQTATGNALNLINNGNSVITRLGNEIVITSVQFRFTISPDTTHLQNTQQRIILFWDRQANGAAPTFTGGSSTASVLDTTTITDPLFAPINYNYVDRYRIIYDKTIILNGHVVLDFDPATGLTQGLLTDSRFISKKIKTSRKVKFDGTGTGIGDIATNSLYVMYVGDVVAAAANPVIEFASRIYFKDA